MALVAQGLGFGRLNAFDLMGALPSYPPIQQEQQPKLGSQLKTHLKLAHQADNLCAFVVIDFYHKPHTNFWNGTLS